MSRRPALIGLVGCAVAFILVAIGAYSVPRLELFDAAAMAGLFGIENGRVDRVADALSRTADLFPWLAALVTLAWLGIRWGRRNEAFASGAAALAAVLASQLLKALLAHPRAQPVLGGHAVGPEALPSGHTTAAMSVAVMAVIVAPADLRRIAVGLGALYAWGVGVALMVLAWHLPSDVIAGMLLATGFGFAALLVPSRSAPRRQPVPLLTRGGAYLVVAVGVVAFAVTIAGSDDKAGQALSYAHSHRSAVVAVVVAGLVAASLLAALAWAARAVEASGRDAGGGEVRDARHV